MAALLLLAALAAVPDSGAPADLVLRSAKIWTGDPARPEAEALAVRGGRIVAVGSDAEIAKLQGPSTKVIDGKWRRVVPGFIDCHTHMSMGGLDLLAMDLRKTIAITDHLRLRRQFGVAPDQLGYGRRQARGETPGGQHGDFVLGHGVPTWFGHRPIRRRGCRCSAETSRILPWSSLPCVSICSRIRF